MSLPMSEPLAKTMEVTLAMGGYAHLFLSRGRDWFLRRSFLTQLTLTALVLTLGVVGLGYYLSKARSNAEFMSEALVTPLMTNDQPYRALEAFLLAPLKAPGHGDWTGSSGAAMVRRPRRLHAPFLRLAATPASFPEARLPSPLAGSAALAFRTTL